MLGQHPQIRTVSSYCEKMCQAKPRLVSYIVTQRRIPLTTEQLHEFLRRSLPEYMVPQVYVQLNALPLTANGKVDRQKLPVPE